MVVTTIHFKGGEGPVRVWGEVVFDPISNSLRVQGDDPEQYIVFYWPNVLFYAVTPAPGGPPVDSELKVPLLTH